MASQTSPTHDEPRTIMKSARYPRVAVLLGVNKYYYIPLLVCRFFSVIFALTWIYQAGRHIHALYQDEVVQTDSVMIHRLHKAQVALSFLWAAEAAYLSHLFSSSLMTRWLSEYSPAAVLVRLCVVSLSLAFICKQTFTLTGALAPDLARLSRCLPIWVCTCIVILLLYFFTQQDISIEEDRDNRKRRLVLRLKCLYTVAPCSLLSLLTLVIIVQIGERTRFEVQRTLLVEVRDRLSKLLGVVDALVKDEL